LTGSFILNTDEDRWIEIQTVYAISFSEANDPVTFFKTSGHTQQNPTSKANIHGGLWRKKIDIEIDILLEFIESEITMQALICEDQTTEIEMNFTNNLTITDIQQNGTPLSFVHTDDIITIQLDDTYNIDDMIEIIVNYEGYPDTKLSD